VVAQKQEKGKEEKKEEKSMNPMDELLAMIPPQYHPLAKIYLEMPQRIDRLEKTVNQIIDLLSKLGSPSSSASPESPPGPSSPLAQIGPLAQFLASLLGGGEGNILPIEFQRQIVANIVANMAQPQNPYKNFLDGFNTALRTMAVITRRKFPELGLEEEEK
jgi:hypothetical protein